MPLSVAFKRLVPQATLPAYAHAADAGADLCACAALTLTPGARALVRTGLAVELPPGYEAQVRPRSGLALKHGITVLNTPGTIDAGYRGEIGVILINLGDAPFRVEVGMRVAQLVVAPVTSVRIVETKDLGASQRGVAGFGSSGV